MNKLLYILANAIFIRVILALGLISYDPEAQMNLIALSIALSIISFLLAYFVYFTMLFVWELIEFILGNSPLLGCAFLLAIVTICGLPYIFLSVGIWAVNLAVEPDLTVNNWLLVAVLAWIPTIFTIRKKNK